MGEKILRHQDLLVYRKAFEAAMQIFELSKSFPKEETYSLTDQIADLHVPYQLISRKHGESEDIRPLSSVN
ncbi:MAG TPA: four helix bundle protein [Pyrinomonadaceae bacterium]|nr:four helix bundle protein [Pyrinomonadaceae bacterium]